MNFTALSLSFLLILSIYMIFNDRSKLYLMIRKALIYHKWWF
jgi:hypothetical protein